MKKFLLLFALALASCAPREQFQYGGNIPLDQTLTAFSQLFNAGNFEAVHGLFAAGAVVQSPVTPNSATLDAFLAAARQRRFQWNFSDTEILFSSRQTARTRSLARMSAPGTFSLLEPVTVNWKFEGGWKISRIEFPNWPPLLGEWKRSGLRGEESLLLVLQPGGVFVLYADRDRSMPSLRGRYQLLANKIIFMDESAADLKRFKPGIGSYLFTSTPGRSLSLSKLEDENSWRAERFEGAWTVNR